MEADLQAKDLHHGLGGLQLHIAGHVGAHRPCLRLVVPVRVSWAGQRMSELNYRRICRN